MKITRVDITRVQVPMRHGTVSSPEYDRDGNAAFTVDLARHILRLHTDAGLTGLGETWKGTPDAAVDAAARALRGVEVESVSLTHLAGRLPHDPDVVNVRDLGRVVAAPVPAIAHNPSIHAAETALADLQGQAWGVPVHQVLGGAGRRRVRVHYWSGRRTPENLAHVARRAQARGFGGIKIKCTLQDPNLERVQAVAAACGPDFEVTLDPNMRFGTPRDTLELGRRLSGLPVACFEDPIPKDDLGLYADLRRRLHDEAGIRLALHLERPEDVLAAIRLEAADLFNLRGTMTGFRDAAWLAHVSGRPVWRGSGLDLGILDASYAHAAAVTPSCTMGSDIVGNFLRADDLIVEPLVYEAGCLVVPQGPGLGVQLDEEALQRHTVAGVDGGPGTWSVM